MSFLARRFRVIAAGIGVVSAIFFSPWITLIVMTLLAFRYRAWETLVIGLLMDFLWLPAGSLISPIPVFTICGIVLVWGLEPLRSQYLAS